MNNEKPSAFLTGAMATGIINAIINGVIQWFQVRDKTEIFLTVDAISNTENTVLGGGVVLATSLAAILTLIGYFSVKSRNKPPFFPKAILITLRNAFFAFGFMVTVSILIQRFMGSITVSHLTATVIIALVAGFVASTVDYMTKKELMSKH